MKRLSRKLGVKPTRDGDGVIAVLQIARRLVKDENLDVIDALNKAADEMAAPRDPVIAFWAAHYAYVMAGVEDPLEALEVASDRQGQVNQLVRKGPR